MSRKKLYADLCKVEDQDDGTLKVWGYASTASKDSEGETVTADAMKAALPDYMKWANVREMHTAKAAGTAIEASVQEDGRTWFGAHIVDSEAVKKVKAGVYKGFSIGGKILDRDDLDKSIIKAIKLVEVSLVDRPANPGAVFTLCKADSVDEEDDENADEETQDKKPEPDEEGNKGEAQGGDGKASEAKKRLSAVDQLADMLNKGVITADALLELAKGDQDANAQKSDDLSDLKKMAGELGDLRKAVGTLREERDDLLKRVKALEAEPAPGKAFLMAVSKGADVTSNADDKEVPLMKGYDGQINEAATLIKMLHAQGGIGMR